MSTPIIKSEISEHQQIELDAYDALQMAYLTAGLVGQMFIMDSKTGYATVSKGESEQAVFAVHQVRRQIEDIYERLQKHVEYAEKLDA